MNKRAPPHQELYSVARELPIFEGVTDKAIAELASMAVCHEYPKNNILFYQGDPGGTVFLVVTGRVKITLMNEEGREVIISSVGPGGLFGLISALDEGLRPANAITTEPSHLAKFDSDAFLRWLDGERAMERLLLRELGHRIRLAYSRIGEHALMGVKDRLLSALLDIADREGRLEPEGETIVFTRPTHQELASRIGSSREVVSRLLKELLESDLLQAEGRVIRVSESALILREETA